MSLPRLLKIIRIASRYGLDQMMLEHEPSGRLLRFANACQFWRRGSGQLDVPRMLTLDTALEWIARDELVEVTPKSIRVRKVVLDTEERKKIEKRTASAAAN